MESSPNVRPSGLQRLNEFPTYRGGDTCVHMNYIWEYLPGHPLQNDWGWVAQHRLVAEDNAGRPLVQSKDPGIAEVGHHKDECKLNNHPSNIEVMTKSAHHRHHQLGKVYSLIDLTEEQVKTALSDTGNSLKAAAGLLGTHSQTIRNRFPKLVDQIKRKSPANLDDVDLLGRMWVCASDPNIGRRDAAAKLGIGVMSVIRICRRYEIPWISKVPNKKGVRHKKKRVSHADDPKVVAQVRYFAANGTHTGPEAARKIGVGESIVRRIIAEHSIVWKHRSRRGEIHRTYRGRPNPKLSATCADETGLGDRQGDLLRYR
jgi:hypothetical protein